MALSTSASAEEIVIVLTGDTGFSRNHSPVHPKGVLKYGKRPPFRDALAGIGKEIDGDLNFTNIETVVTDRNNLRRDTKGQRGPFNFRTHPNGLRALVDAGFNVLSLANNHSMDYGPAGLRETLKHVAALPGDPTRLVAGIGEDRDAAAAVAKTRIKGVDFAFGALGIATNNLARHRAGDNKPGQLAYRFDADFRTALTRLRGTAADYRMLSIHYGVEGQVRTDARQIKDWRRRAARDGAIDLVIGHHAHVVRAVERVGNALVFYGLGNFIHHGTANMTRKGICKDYGLVARIHLKRSDAGLVTPLAVEVLPVTQTHIAVTRLAPAASTARVHALNYLAGKLPQSRGTPKAEGLRFTPQKDGRGLYCFAKATEDASEGRAATLCKGWTPAPQPPASLRRRIARSCAR
ncbi:MAG: CapA family protein [Pseudomonadota bacterium]